MFVSMILRRLRPAARLVVLSGFAISFLGAADASAQLVLRNLNETIDGGSFFLDLNQDGESDFIIEDNGEGESTIRTLIDTNNLDAGIIATFPDEFAVPVVFSPGDEVSIDVFSIGLSPIVEIPSQEFLASEVFLSGFLGTPFNETGATGFVGLAVTDRFEDTNFGFLEITRGSTILGVVGFQSTPGAPAIVTIPEPVSSVLSLAGLACVMATRRQKQAARSKALLAAKT